MGSKAGIVYDNASGALLRLIIPSSDGELSDPRHVGTGETMIVADKDQAATPAQVFGLIESAVGYKPPVTQLRYVTEFPAVEFWGSSAGPVNTTVSGGVFRSLLWSPDFNHLQSLGGVGVLRLMAFRDHQGWETSDAGGIVSANFTSARIIAGVRGVNFAANGSDLIIWIQARHPSAPGKFVNWGRTGRRLTDKLSGGFQTIDETLDPDPALWAWGQGAGVYDTFLSIGETLRNIYNVHLVMWGPDGTPSPGGQFEMNYFEARFARRALL